jgi:kinesin family protein 1
MVGFAEREGTEVHAQLFIPGISGESGVTTTQMIKDFDEGAVRFESVHSMSVPMFSPTSISLRVAIFAKVSSTHLDKLLSWDDMRDSAPRPQQKRNHARIAESQFYMEEKHDVFARVQILELSENGDYRPVEVMQTSDVDKGTYQLHQGLQRRIVINLTHSSGEALPWQEVSGLRVGRVQLVDHAGKAPDLSSPVVEIPLKVVSKPIVRQNSNGTSNVIVVGQWDSSVHGSLALDRVTPDKYKVQMALLWDVTSDKLAEPMTFSINLFSQILSRTYVRSTGMFASLWQSVRIVHSMSGIFAIAVKPSPVKRAGDLWRMNTQNDYVKGEEALSNWAPRGVSLIRDYIAANRRKVRLGELEKAQGLLSRIEFPKPSKTLLTNGDASDKEHSEMNGSTNGNGNGDTNGEAKDVANEGSNGEVNGEPEASSLSEHDKAILEKYVGLWKMCHDPITSILTPSNVEPPANGAPPSRPPPNLNSIHPPNSDDEEDAHRQPMFLATVAPVTKNASILKGGYLLTPSADSTRWVRRFAELRQPYLHIHSVPDGEEIGIVSLRNSRIDHSPQIAKLLRRDETSPNSGGARGRAGEPEAGGVFAIYGTDNTWLFKARNDREKVEWIFSVDQAYFGGGSENEMGSGDDDYYY